MTGNSETDHPTTMYTQHSTAIAKQLQVTLLPGRNNTPKITLTTLE